VAFSDKTTHPISNFYVANVKKSAVSSPKCFMTYYKTYFAVFFVSLPYHKNMSVNFLPIAPSVF
jgi:hypothetical protein